MYLGGGGKTGLHTKEVCVFVCLAPEVGYPSLPVCPGPVSKHSRCLLGAIHRFTVATFTVNIFNM